MTTSEQSPTRRPVVVFVGVMTVAAVAAAVAVAGLPSPVPPQWVALPVLAMLLVAATWLVVPFRYGGSVDAINLVEAVLAPLLLGFPPLVVVGVAAFSQIANGLLRRLPWTKTVFNTAMWGLAAAAGSAVVLRVGTEPVWPTLIVGLVVALAVVAIINNVAFTIVVALAEQVPLRRAASKLVPVARTVWVGGWAVNVAVGVLFALAYLTSPIAVLVFIGPLVVLDVAYRSYSAARADQHLLSSVHGAIRRLGAPIDPRAAIRDFLEGVAESFEAARTELVLSAEREREIHALDRATGRYTVRVEDDRRSSLAGLVAAAPAPVDIGARRDDPLSLALDGVGARNCLGAPLRDGERVLGALLVLDRAGFEGSQSGQMAIIESLARETSGALAKGQLLADVLEERRKLGRIVETTSDGIATVTRSGTVLTWNPGLEHITGLAEDDVVGQTQVLQRLHVRTLRHAPVDLSRERVANLPADVLITAVDGSIRHLQCSYSEVDVDGEDPAVVIIARDVTPTEEREALQAQVTELQRADAERRVMVEQLQQSVMPQPLALEGASIAAAYEPSDPSEPTGGDLYDWQVLPSGEVHIAVVDILGHGVAATKEALAVVHTLRVATAAGTPLAEVVARADELLRKQHNELVATVIVARFDPSTGRVQIVSGGHPPALVVTAAGDAQQIMASGGVIGWPGAGSDDVAEAMLEPGDALILYTDGLVEANKNILDGIDLLMRHASQVVNLDAQAMASELLTRALAGAARRDDTLALVLRREPVAVTPEAESSPTEAEAQLARDLFIVRPRNDEVDVLALANHRHVRAVIPKVADHDASDPDIASPAATTDDPD